MVNQYLPVFAHLYGLRRADIEGLVLGDFTLYRQWADDQLNYMRAIASAAAAIAEG